MDAFTRIDFMKLNDLLTQIKPLEADSEQPLTKAYVKHASTHFPELVRALEELVNEPVVTAEQMAEARSILARAKEIKL